MRPVAWTVLLMLAPAAQGASATLPRSAAEQTEVEQRLTDFYAHPQDPRVMLRRPAKYATATGQEVHPHQDLRLNKPDINLLKDLAGIKSTPEFLRQKCDPARTKKFRKPPCAPVLEATMEDDDQVEDLIDSWLPAGMTAPVHSLDEVPSAGTVDTKPWSDDYWRTKWGGVAYRYADGTAWMTYAEAVAFYAQPREWTALASLSTADAQATIAGWSPAEKYDLVTGAGSFSLTNEQKGEGANELKDGDVPDWVGICEGWSSAAIMTPRPTQTVLATAPTGLSVPFYPADVRALASLAWARGNFSSNDIGGRCDAEAPTVFPNGRLQDQECFDTNPATFHLSLANMIGKAHQSFIIDAAFDSEVWNQALVAYEFTYFNPLKPEQRSSSWNQVAVPYDEAFKSKDRFQVPLTRGVRHGDEWDDAAVDKVVGVMATIVYNDEYSPNPGAKTAADATVRATYIYDLELSADANGALIPTGGEWQSNAHPDFLWVPRRDSTLALSGQDVAFRTDVLPTAALAKAAKKASEARLPLCSVLSELVLRSSGNGDDDSLVICQP